MSPQPPPIAAARAIALAQAWLLGTREKRATIEEAKALAEDLATVPGAAGEPLRMMIAAVRLSAQAGALGFHRRAERWNAAGAELLALAKDILREDA